MSARAAPVGRSAVSVAPRADSRKAKCRLLGASSVVVRVQPGRRAFVTWKSWRDKAIMRGARAPDSAVSDSLFRRHVSPWSSGDPRVVSPGEHPTVQRELYYREREIYPSVCVWVLATGGTSIFACFPVANGRPLSTIGHDLRSGALHSGGLLHPGRCRREAMHQEARTSRRTDYFQRKFLSSPFSFFLSLLLVLSRSLSYVRCQGSHAFFLFTRGTRELSSSRGSIIVYS